MNRNQQLLQIEHAAAIANLTIDLAKAINEIMAKYPYPISCVMGGVAAKAAAIKAGEIDLDFQRRVVAAGDALGPGERVIPLKNLEELIKNNTKKEGT